MTAFIALVVEMLTEIRSKKIVLIVTSLSALTICAIVVYCLTGDFRQMIHNLQPSADDPDGIALREKVRSMYMGIAGIFYGVAVFVSLFITSDIIPSLFTRGLLDLYLSKPLPRWLLLMGRLTGGFIVVFALVSGFIVIVWFIISLSTGVWSAQVVASLLPVFLSFFVLYALQTLFALLTRSAGVGLIVCYTLAAIISPVLNNRESMLFPLLSDKTLQQIVTGLYYILPQISDVNQITIAWIQGNTITVAVPFIGLSIWIASLFLLCGVVFTRKEF